MKKLWDKIVHGSGESEPSAFRGGLWIFAGGYLFYLAYSVGKELITQAPNTGELIAKILFILLFIVVGIFFALTGFFTMKRSLAKTREETAEAELIEEEQEKKIEESTTNSKEK